MHRTRTIAQAVVLPMLLVATSVAAQSGATSTAAPSRAIQLPDTLGANFSIADSASRSGAPNDYEFLLGEWHFRFQQRHGDGSWGRPFSGHWTANKATADGALLMDHWRADDLSSPASSGTYTFRSFNPARKLWEMQGVESRGGSWQPGLTWSDSTSRYAVQHYGTTVMRIRYLAIAPTHFLWRADASEDGGRTWLLDNWTMEATRIAK